MRAAAGTCADVPARLDLGRLGLGLATLGDVFGVTPADLAGRLLDLCRDNRVRYLDTAPLYGTGISERRLGAALTGHDREQFVISTKVGRTLTPDAPLGWEVDFSRDAILRGLEGSLDRLGTDRVDVLYLHDPDDHEEQVLREAWPTVERLREEGVVRAIGIGTNHWELPDRLLGRVDLDLVMLAGRYTLLDTSGAGFLDRASAHGVGVVLAGVLNSGILVAPASGAWFDYRPASPELIERARDIRDVVVAHGVPLPVAAIRFAAAHPAVVNVTVGIGSPAQLMDGLTALETEGPAEMWAELAERGLVRQTSS